jgi:hypothetical protein
MRIHRASIGSSSRVAPGCRREGLSLSPSSPPGVRGRPMGRIRTIKPEFFKHSELFDAEQETKLPLRLAYAGLWTCCDREGRFKWRPRELKIDILPYDDCDFSRVLDALATRGFIVRYACGTEEFGYVPTFRDHQFINHKEPQSQIPKPLENQEVDACATRGSPVSHASSTRDVKEGKGKEGNGNGLDASMVASGVITELRISGQRLRMAIEEVARSEIASGSDPTDLRDRMIRAGERYQRAKPGLSFAPGLEKFYGEGMWRDESSWPWRNGNTLEDGDQAGSQELEHLAISQEERGRIESVRRTLSRTMGRA